MCAKLACMGLNVCECTGKAESHPEDGYHHTVGWQRYCRKLTFRACRPRPILVMRSDWRWILGEGPNFYFSWGTKNCGGGRGLALSSTESSLVQTFCESCVHLDITHLAIHMTRGLVIQGCPTLNKLLTCMSVIWLLLLKVLHILHARTIPT